MIKDFIKTLKFFTVIASIVGTPVLILWLYEENTRPPQLDEWHVEYQDKHRPSGFPTHWSSPHPYHGKSIVRWNHLRWNYLPIYKNTKQYRRYDYNTLRYSSHIDSTGLDVLDTIFLKQAWNDLDVFFTIDHGGFAFDTNGLVHIKTHEAIGLSF